MPGGYPTALEVMGARFGVLAWTRAAAVALLEEVAVRPEPCGMSLVCPGGACRELCAQVGCRGMLLLQQHSPGTHGSRLMS